MKKERYIKYATLAIICAILALHVSLSRRFSGHKEKYIACQKGKAKWGRRVNEIFDKFGIENCKIELIEDFPCQTKAELLKREGHHIRTADCVNKIISGRTQKEYWKEYSEKNRTTIHARNKTWYENRI